jgi:2,4-dienoyl-CoA reductase-like NADH-dependent reductase (Old Yellow Enzyme family)
VKEIVQGIRKVVSNSFIIGIKLNSVDYMHGDLSEAEIYKQIESIASYGVDFVEISGGSYEHPRVRMSQLLEISYLELN